VIVGSYVGPATVVLPDGAVLTVVAFLQSAGSADAQMWRGVLTADDPQLMWATLRAAHATLRLPYGREGVFAPVGLVGLAGEELRINGTGPAPF